MGQTPTFNDRFAPRGAAAKDGSATDRFAGPTARAGIVDHFGAIRPAIRGDAFAGRGRTAKLPPVDRFGARPTPVDAPSLAEPARPPVVPPVVLSVAQRPAPPKRALLHVVAAQPEIAQSEPVEVKYQDLKREEAWRRKTRTSSLVLVSGTATAADVIDAPPPAPPAPAPKAEIPPPPPLLADKAPVRSGGGGGGAGRGEPPRERGFNQDDFVGVMLGAAVVVLLLLWLMRGGQQPDNPVVGVQSAMNDPIALPAAAPAPPPLPPPDPFGDRAVDLTPKGPIPQPAPDTSKATVAEAAPAPAAPVPVGDRSMHAWFCTAGSKLTVASRKTLEGELEQFSAAFAGKELVVRGYADTRGTSDYNSALGGQRASVVADFLRTKGLNVVDAAGVGELTGLDDNKNCSNQRRVDVFVKGGPGEAPSRACAPEPDVEDLVCG